MNWFEAFVLAGLFLILLEVKNVLDSIREVVNMLRVSDLRGRKQ